MKNESAQDKRSLFSNFVNKWLIVPLKPKYVSPKDRSPIIILVVILLVFGLVFRFTPNISRTYVLLETEGQQFFLEHLGRTSQHRQGLKQRPFIPPNGGAFFELRRSQVISISMESVNFPLRVATLNDAFQVQETVILEPGVDYTFEKPARFFLEVSAEVILVPKQSFSEFESDFKLSVRSFKEVRQF